MRSLRLFRLLPALLLGASLVGCSSNPTTGRSQFNLLSRDEEIAIGEEAKGQLTAEYGGAVPDAQTQAYVREVGSKLAAQTEGDAPSLPWEFTLLDSEVVNAFALPGGKTFISRGLAEKFDSEAELAFVMGHEVGHVTARHQNEQISRQIAAAIVVAGVGIAANEADSEVVKAGVPVVVGAGTGLYLLRFGRGQELEADELGMRYMTKVGYDPEAARDAMNVLKELSENGERPPELLSTHPYPENRLDQINDRLRTIYAEQVGNPAYKRYETEYKRRMLNRLAMLPPPPDAGRAVVLSDPSTWCALCAPEHQEESAESSREVASAGLQP
ncbi:MAG: M48 family peptidase [Leptolyngbya sp. PLA3]|nr:MAG: M48 family peptidase [Cyanobacteria bacterium CYA]MCE7968667.1 M48 family peptidase [Leptolyngbya sp. PL-A3]